MGEFWNQWYQMGSPLVQAGFLIAGVCSVRAILKSMRSSQERMAALLELTVSAGGGEDGARSHPRAAPYFSTEAPETTAPAVSTSQSAAARAGVWRGVSTWLQAPMAHSGVSTWQKAVRWLQAPAGT